jgi:hypothetical protein
MNNRLQALRDKWERLSQRERAMVSALGITFVVLMTMLVAFLVTDGLSSMDERNSDMRQALRDLDTQRDSYLRARNKVQALDSRLGRPPIQLQGFLEQAAKDSGFEIPESKDQPPTPAGKKYVEHSADIQLRDVTLEQLTSFMRKVEGGENLVVITALNIRVRDDKHQKLDVAMSISTFERDTSKSGAKKGDKS